MPEPSQPSHQDQQRGKGEDSHLALRWSRHPIVWIGTLLTAVITAFLVALAGGFGQHIAADGGHAPKLPAGVPKLEVDAVRIQSTRDTTKPLKLDFTLRNIGSQLAVITATRLTVQQFAELPHCLSQGSLPSTGIYHANMPTDPPPGTRIDIPVSQQIGPDAADRFDVSLRLPPDHAETAYVYRVHIEFLYDNAIKPLSAGQALITLPIVPDGTYFWTKADRVKGDPIGLFMGSAIPQISKCMIENSDRLRTILSMRGIRTTPLASVPSQLSFCCAIKTPPSVKAARCPGHPKVIRPVSMIIECDGSGDLQHMKWSAWTFSDAVGAGIYHLDNCTPSCAAGKFHNYPVSVHLDQATFTGTAWVWNRAVFRFPEKEPFGTRSLVLANFGPVGG
jgi:hypothetical protein